MIRQPVQQSQHTRVYASSLSSTKTSPIHVVNPTNLLAHSGIQHQPVIRKAYVNSTAGNIPMTHQVNEIMNRAPIHYTNQQAPKLFTQARVKRRFQHSPNIREAENLAVPLLNSRQRVNSNVLPISRIIPYNNYPAPNQVVANNMPHKIRVKDGEKQIDINLHINFNKDGTVSCSHADTKHVIQEHNQTTMNDNKSSRVSNMSTRFNDNIDFTVEQESVYCVICQETYRVNDQQRHLTNHRNRFVSANQKNRSIQGNQRSKLSRIEELLKSVSKPFPNYVRNSNVNQYYQRQKSRADHPEEQINKSGVRGTRTKIRPSMTESGVGQNYIDNRLLQIRESQKRQNNDFSFHNTSNIVKQQQPSFVLQQPSQSVTYMKNGNKEEHENRRQIKTTQNQSNLSNNQQSVIYQRSSRPQSRNILTEQQSKKQKLSDALQEKQITQPQRNSNFPIIKTISAEHIQSKQQTPVVNRTEILKIDQNSQQVEINPYGVKSKSKRRMKQSNLISPSKIGSSQVDNKVNFISNNFNASNIQPKRRQQSQRFERDTFQESNVNPQNLVNQRERQRESLNNSFDPKLNANVNTNSISEPHKEIQHLRDSNYSNSPQLYNYGGQSRHQPQEVNRRTYENEETQYSPMLKPTYLNEGVQYTEERRQTINEQTQYTPQNSYKQPNQSNRFTYQEKQNNALNSKLSSQVREEHNNPGLTQDNQSQKSNHEDQRISAISSKPAYENQFEKQSNHESNRNQSNSHYSHKNQKQIQNGRQVPINLPHEKSIVNGYSPNKNNENDLFNEIIDTSRSRQAQNKKVKKRKIPKGSLLQWN